MSKSDDGVIERLMERHSQELSPEEKRELESIIPKKCLTCNTSVVCSLIPSFMHMAKAGVQLSIDKCPFFVEMQ